MNTTTTETTKSKSSKSAAPKGPFLVATDGKKFAVSEMAAFQAHEAGLAVMADADADVEAFLDHAGYVKHEPGTKGGSTRTIAKRAIQAFIAYTAESAAE